MALASLEPWTCLGGGAGFCFSLGGGGAGFCFSLGGGGAGLVGGSFFSGKMGWAVLESEFLTSEGGVGLGGRLFLSVREVWSRGSSCSAGGGGAGRWTISFLPFPDFEDGMINSHEDPQTFKSTMD